MKDPGKDKYVVVSSFYWREVFKPSFIGRLQSTISKIFGVGSRKKLYDNTKFKLIMVPADEQPVEKTPARALVEYWEEALSKEKLADMAERMKSIPPEQMKEMFKEWWKISAKQYLADNELNANFDGDTLDILFLEGRSNESSSSETDES